MNKNGNFLGKSDKSGGREHEQGRREHAEGHGEVPYENVKREMSSKESRGSSPKATAITRARAHSKKK